MDFVPHVLLWELLSIYVSLSLFAWYIWNMLANQRLFLFWFKASTEGFPWIPVRIIYSLGKLLDDSCTFSCWLWNKQPFSLKMYIVGWMLFTGNYINDGLWLSKEYEITNKERLDFWWFLQVYTQPELLRLVSNLLFVCVLFRAYSWLYGFLWARWDTVYLKYLCERLMLL